jgi:transcription-repair coupling factor (superfamily II helicase)
MSERNDQLIAAIRRQLAGTRTVAGLVERIASDRLSITGLASDTRGLLLATLQELTGRRIAIIVPSDAELNTLETSLRLFHPHPQRLAIYPTPALSPYQDVPPSLAVTRAEMLALGELSSGEVDTLVLPARALFRRLPDPGSFGSRTLHARTDRDLDIRAILEQLVTGGYSRVDLVGEIGDFAYRGGIIDIFPPNLARPVRIELFGDTVESIREFDPEDQKSDTVRDSVVVYPMTHFPLDREVRARLARRMSLDFNDPIYKRDLAARIDLLNEHGHFTGLEYNVPLVEPGTTFLELLAGGDDWLICTVEPGDAVNSVEHYSELLRNDYEASSEKAEAVYPPHQLLVPVEEITSLLDAAPLAITELALDRTSRAEIRLQAPRTDRFVNRLSELPAALARSHNDGLHQLLFVSTRGGREKVERLLGEFSVPFADDAPRLGAEIVVSHGPLASGFRIPEASLEIYSEWDLFEPPTSTPSGRRRKTDVFLTDLRDLRAGDLIVHVDHGIGRYHGLRRIPFGDTEREVMELEYGGGGRLLLPMESLNLIQKYSGGADSEPRLDKLGGTSWARTKASVKKAMRDMADELLKLYATRRMVRGHPFAPDTPWQHQFEESFEFEETDDQLAAIEDVKNDMETPRPMDRLLCGDVGYGKTEVAMRAAFKAVMDGKQVAVLAPTTILAYQHYRTFLRRFASFPVAIELVSRFRSPKEQKEIAAKLTSGEIDLVVGTHRLLSKDVLFKDLGLLVIDEEQRFGVAQKERLKQFKKSVDVLAMSATPIPRTLNMSMIGIRDVSIIETPPKDRLAIQTAVVSFSDELIKEALEFEIERGGQIFFVHNRIDSIYGMKEYLERLVPGIRVIVGHGQMDEQVLEKAMMSFIAREYDLLLSTTIIENGIDIPACNTILINHADKFGLSQLYQLRGRVGRSDRLAFCYLLVPSERALSSDARKRLSAIQEFSDLGAGFRIAAKDLEIRGAGNLLGGEQSGQIAAVGFETYSKLLEETISELKGERIEEEIETTMNLGVDIYIPPGYIADENLRMTFYKRVASARDEERVGAIRTELRDRFGPLPRTVENLFEFVRLRLVARSIGVISIARERKLVAVRFHQEARIDPEKLMDLLSSTPEARFAPSGVLSVVVEGEGGEIIEQIRATIGRIARVA